MNDRNIFVSLRDSILAGERDPEFVFDRLKRKWKEKFTGLASPVPILEGPMEFRGLGPNNSYGTATCGVRPCTSQEIKILRKGWRV